jgi:hypothetical protein
VSHSGLRKGLFSRRRFFLGATSILSSIRRFFFTGVFGASSSSGRLGLSSSSVGWLLFASLTGVLPFLENKKLIADNRKLAILRLVSRHIIYVMLLFILI